MADKKDGLSYIDDIPLKISSAFLPPPHIVIPLVPNSNEAMKLTKYDFSFERKVLEDIRQRDECLENASKQNTYLDGQEQDSNSHKPNVIPLQSEILLPKPQQAHDTTASKSEQNNSKINLSDFENDTSSPFDYVELQTINDLEELSNVFQGLNNKFNSDNNVNRDNCEDSAENNGMVNFTKSVSFPLQGRKLENKDTPHSWSTSNENDAISRTVLYQVPCFSSSTAKTRNSDDLSIPTPSKSKLRGCKSYSDLHNLSEKTPKMTVMVENPDTSKDSKDAGEVNCDNALPDPYYELSKESREFVDAVSGMGFPRDQVSRSVKHLGTDEKTVVDHLCQIQNLEECGYDCLEAEAALHLHDYNPDQAKLFLDLINKFQDLGFEKNAVKKALIQNKNDESKTIDALLS